MQFCLPHHSCTGCSTTPFIWGPCPLGLQRWHSGCNLDQGAEQASLEYTLLQVLVFTSLPTTPLEYSLQLFMPPSYSEPTGEQLVSYLTPRKGRWAPSQLCLSSEPMKFHLPVLYQLLSVKRGTTETSFRYRAVTPHMLVYLCSARFRPEVHKEGLSGH